VPLQGSSGGSPASAAAVSSPFIYAPPDVVVGEADGYVDLPVTLSAPGLSTVYMYYETLNGTAAGASTTSPCPTYTYQPLEGTLTFPPGVTTQVLRIALSNCAVATPGHFSLDLYSAANGIIARAGTTISIVEHPTVPGAPTAVTATAGNRKAVVAFTAPASDGGNPINAYTVTASPGGASSSSAASPITITGLTNGTAYTFKVTATNAVGTGHASAASKAVIPGTPPTVPTAARAASGSTKAKTGSLTVTFRAPASNGGPPILRYTAKCTSAKGGVTRSGTHSGSTAAPVTVGSATTGKAYTCTVTATNALGTSAASAASAPVTVGAPGAPGKVTVARTAAGRIKASFTPAASNGSPVTSYSASCASSNGGATRAKSGTSSPITVTGLTAGKRYTCTVTATNARGKSPASNASGPVTA
jgi:hypothetical protein